MECVRRCGLHPLPEEIMSESMIDSSCGDVQVDLKGGRNSDAWGFTMTMTMTHSEKSHIRRMKAWPHRQECRGHDPTKKNLFY